MNDFQEINLRVPPKLKDKVAELAHEQNLSVNEFINRVLTEFIKMSDSMNADKYFAQRVEGKSKEEITEGFLTVMAKVQKQGSSEPVPDWDKLPEGMEPVDYVSLLEEFKRIKSNEPYTREELNER